MRRAFSYIFSFLLFSATVCFAQQIETVTTTTSAPVSVSLNLPKWILGTWSNSYESDSRRKEWFSFTAKNIQFSYFVEDEQPRTSKPENIVFSDKFKDYEVREIIESNLYRVTFSKGTSEYIYEFKMCGECYVSSKKQKALTYSLTENKEIMRSHSTSLQAVMIRIQE